MKNNAYICTAWVMPLQLKKQVLLCSTCTIFAQDSYRCKDYSL